MLLIQPETARLVREDTVIGKFSPTELVIVKERKALNFACMFGAPSLNFVLALGSQP